MKRAIRMLGALAVLAGFFLAAPAANAQTFPNQTFGGITCQDYRNYNPNAAQVYPNDGHYFVCATGTFAPTNQRANVPMNAVVNLRPAPAQVKPMLQNQNVRFYFFKNRTDANTFMNAKHGGGNPFSSSTAQCGSTGFLPGPKTIESIVYNTCSYPTPPTDDISLQKATLHEAGHAFDFSIAAANNRGFGPAKSKAFKNLAAAELQILTPANNPNPAQNWATMTPTQRAAYVCNLFSTNTPSGLENALGANPVGFVGQVCTNGTATGLKAEYVGKTPTEIAELKLPYFVGAADPQKYQELFSEQFSTQNGQTGVSGAPILRFSDRVLTLGTVPVPSYKCVRVATDAFIATGNPPTNTVMMQQGCPSIPASDWTTQ